MEPTITKLRRFAPLGKPSDKVSVITLSAWGDHPFEPHNGDPITRVTLRTVARWLDTAASHDGTATIHVWTLPNGVVVADASYYVRGCPNRFRVAFTDTFTLELRNN